MSTVTDLNGLQCMMLRWEEFHAMNAVHVVHLGRSYDPVHVQLIVTEKCLQLGLTQIEFLSCRRKVHFVESQSDESAGMPFRYLTRSGRIESVLQRLLNDELNSPFSNGVHWPVRFTLLEHEQGQYLVLSYQHALSDSRGITLILKEIVRALNGAAPVVAKLDRSPPPIRKLVADQFNLSNLVERGLNTCSEVNASLSCYHHPSKFSGDLTVESGVHVVDLSTEILKHTSRSLGVKVQDLLFASLLEALSLNFSSELAKSRRKNIGIYAPADLRAESVVNTDATIGQILGCITVREQVGPGMSFSELVRNVASQTSSVKKRKAHRDHSFHMNVMSRIWDLFPDRLNRVAGPYLIPLSGYISNVNLTDFLAEELVNGTIRNYFRYSGTGLLSPMMLGITTLGPVFNLTTTHHRDVFTHEDITRIVSHVQMRLAGHVELSGCRKEVPARSSARKPVGVI